MFGYYRYYPYLWCMKKLTLIILITITSLISYGNVDSTLILDKLTFKYINKYRKSNKVSKIKWSDELYSISKSHNKKLVNYNLVNTPKLNSVKLFHSGSNTYENCLNGGYVKKTDIVTPELKKFIKKYFNLKDLTTMDYIALNIVYAWHKSPSHRKNMLRKDVKNGSVNYTATPIKVKTFDLNIYFATANLK